MRGVSLVARAAASSLSNSTNAYTSLWRFLTILAAEIMLFPPPFRPRLLFASNLAIFAASFAAAFSAAFSAFFSALTAATNSFFKAARSALSSMAARRASSWRLSTTFRDSFSFFASCTPSAVSSSTTRARSLSSAASPQLGASSVALLKRRTAETAPHRERASTKSSALTSGSRFFKKTVRSECHELLRWFSSLMETRASSSASARILARRFRRTERHILVHLV
mmetsp:Transcript_61522/g.139271  ORF Transcript_61522/g.139271 Transcript_61522/m.139271 type:complete len:225 (+) Transcript_61522:665-1339(+)